MQKINTENTLQLDLFQFKAKGHDQFIDFVKGFAIISVVLLHNLGHTAMNRYGIFSLWIGQAVPNIFLIQMLVFWIMRTNGWVSYNTSLKTICFVFVLTFLSLFFSFVKFCIAEKKKKMEKWSRV